MVLITETRSWLFVHDEHPNKLVLCFEAIARRM